MFCSTVSHGKIGTENWRDTVLVNYCHLTGGVSVSFASYGRIGTRNCLD
jgi:hypothetical protein